MSSSLESSPSSRGAKLVSHSILIVEDDDSVRKSLLRLLQSHGWTCVSVDNGTDALQAAILDPPTLVIIDLQLPGMSGADVVRTMRRHKALASIPVIALSATLEDTPGEMFARALTKPCSAQSLLTAIDETIAGLSSSRAGRSS
jgi:CheY-like chemotaxis protein